jgi:hypothetical protein
MIGKEHGTNPIFVSARLGGRSGGEGARGKARRPDRTIVWMTPARRRWGPTPGCSPSHKAVLRPCERHPDFLFPTPRKHHRRQPTTPSNGAFPVLTVDSESRRVENGSPPLSTRGRREAGAGRVNAQSRAAREWARRAPWRSSTGNAGSPETCAERVDGVKESCGAVSGYPSDRRHFQPRRNPPADAASRGDARPNSEPADPGVGRMVGGWALSTPTAVLEGARSPRKSKSWPSMRGGGCLRNFRSSENGPGPGACCCFSPGRPLQLGVNVSVQNIFGQGSSQRRMFRQSFLQWRWYESRRNNLGTWASPAPGMGVPRFPDHLL